MPLVQTRILQHSHVLEDKFYREGLANFNAEDFEEAGYTKAIRDNIEEVSYDETTHVSFLTTALKGMHRRYLHCKRLIIN